MAASLTDAQLAYLRSEISEELASEDDLTERYERLGDVVAVAREVVKQRFADVMAAPGAYNVTGVYSQDNTSLIRGLTAQLTRLATTRVDPDGAAESDGLPLVVRAQLRGRRSR